MIDDDTVIHAGIDWVPQCLRNKNLIDVFSKCTELIISTDNMSDAVNSAYKVSKPGDVVLLSPACSSFDLFDSYEDRGNKFKEEVRKL